MELIDYIEVNSIGVAILAVMLIHMLGIQKYFNKNANRYFTYMLIDNMIILVADTIIYLTRYHKQKFCFFISGLSAEIYYLATVLFGYLWLMYAIKTIYPKYVVSVKKRRLLALPVIICALFIIPSPWTKLIFYFTDQNRYVRGSLMPLTILAVLIYVAASYVVVVHEMRNPGVERANRSYVALLIFPLPAVAGCFIQWKFYGVSLQWICTAISILICFVEMQQTQISRDMLTGLYNRHETDKQISWQLKKNISPSDRLFVMMIDVDAFKQINDTYGHVVGDQALVNSASILIKSFRTKDFIGRFGGDEFIVIGRLGNDEDADSFVENVHKNQQAFNEKAKTYKLSLSVGYIVYDSSDDLTSDKIISDADQQMYMVKNKRKNS